ncbi:MAG: histidine kinase [Flavobacteriaceae bacterium]|nr:histidine kinase [Flavobacteriaceae bacterium]
MLKEEEVLLILYSIITIFILIFFVVVFVVAFQKRKNKLLLEQMEAKKKFETELANSQIEIQEQTFKNIAWELHDNIGQLLSVANIQLGMLLNESPKEFKPQIEETKTTLGTTLQEVRALSKTLNNEVVLKNGLDASLENELNRYQRLRFVATELKIEGNKIHLTNEVEIILFRILQEFFSNTLKHAFAKKIFVSLCYGEKTLEITASDDGEGFDPAIVKTHSGLLNMQSRANVIGADFILTSKKGKGTQMQLTYPYPIHEYV